jgi:uncharacterized membrane protein
MAINQHTHTGGDVRNDLEQMAAEWGLPIAIMIGVVLLKATLVRVKRSWKDWLRHIFVALFVGYLLQSYLNDIPEQSLPSGAKGPILALVVLQADNLLAGLLKLGKAFADDPQGFFADFGRVIVDIYKGRK